MHKLNLKLFTLVACLFVMGVGGGVHADDLIAQIKARAEKIREYKELLTNPDQVTRLAALDVMLKSEDIVMKNTAFTAAFNSDDEQVRGVALKHRFSSIDNLPLIAKSGDVEQTFIIDIREFDIVTGKFAGSFRGLNYSAAIYGTTVKGGGSSGTFELRLTDGGKLVGAMQTRKERFSVSAELM